MAQSQQTAPPIQQVISGLGSKVRQLRRQKNLSLQQLSERSDVSAAAIHKIERSGMVPTVATLMKLAAALNRSVSYFVEEDSSTSCVFVRAGERKRVFTSKAGLDLQGISGPYGPFFVAGALATMEPGADSGPRAMEHPGEELVFILEGTIRFVIDGEEQCVGPGDALHWRTDRPHRWSNPTSQPARCLWFALRAP
ncbi:MAG: cupin domain-containing protein [Candidatus Dormibacteraeota bacterium]|jgi:transcriptional regulator with XRE-family HTH domain|nr:cupin domain-containing protein [Candidatus Dormibacteraeota bacterium]